MNAICGRIGSISSRSANLQSSLESKLRARSTGSILYKLTWKHRTTPSGRVICALRASTVRTSAKDFILSPWPTTTTTTMRDCKGANNSGPLNRGTKGNPLNEQVLLAGWATARANDGTGSKIPEGRQGGIALKSMVELSGWNTSRATDGSNGGPNQANGALSADAARCEPIRLCSDGHLLTGSIAGMESGGRLNPAHSRWLMRLPREWDDCVPMATRSTSKRRRNSVKPSKKFVMEYDL